MKELKFKTNLHCDGCVSKVTPYLRAVPGIVHWEVDLESPDKTLTVFGDDAKESEIVEKVRESGYQITQIEMPLSS
ncbi:MAG: heavy-metal-associated domain-containing protein [Ignavibacteria bacterium]|nr:heavy-metal-associated domain-containing protein [Ignavibacteria bacterium]